QHFVAPQRGRLGLKRVLDVLAVVEATLIEPDYPGAFRYLAARNRKRALTVLFTDVIDRFASDALVANVASLRPRHLPLAVTLQNPELNPVAPLRPVAAHDAFRKASAEELLRAREEALGRMPRDSHSRTPTTVGPLEVSPGAEGGSHATAWHRQSGGPSPVPNVSFRWSVADTTLPRIDATTGHLVAIKAGITQVRVVATNFDV